jgi:hypothetical protein
MIEPDLLYTVLCDEVRREHNGKLILLGLFEQIAVSQFPAQHPGCCVVNKWCNGEGQWTQQTRFVDGDDNVIVEGETIQFDLPGLLSHFTAVQVYAGLPLQKSGPMFVEVLLNGELKQRYALHVLQAT